MISAGVQNCLMCLILSSALQSKATDPNLVDKETILSFLQVTYITSRGDKLSAKLATTNTSTNTSTNTVQIQVQYKYKYKYK